MSNYSPISPWSSTVHLKSSWNIFIILIIFYGTPYFFMIAHMLSRFRVQIECCLPLVNLLMMFRSINTCSVVPMPFLYPACSFLNLSSTPLLILSIIMLHSIFPTQSKVTMHFQFLQCLVFPFFACLMICSRLQLFGISSYCHIFFIS